MIFHIDFDYFYAQCEEVRNPGLKGMPVVVCVFSDRGGDSGAVATANYIARGYGVKSGMPIRFARKNLEGVKSSFLPTDFEHYEKVSGRAMKIISAASDIFEYVGKDEAYLDVTKKVGGDFAAAGHLAQQIKNEIRKDVKLTCSVGISPNKMISKIASDHKKPDGLTIVYPHMITEFLENCDVRDIPGIGKKYEERLESMEITSIKKLKELDVFELNGMFGRKNGTYMYNAARGIDDEPVKEREASMQYGRIVTLKQDTLDYGFLTPVLDKICAELHRTILHNNKMFKSVGIQILQADMAGRTKSRMLRNHTSDLGQMCKTARLLLAEALADQQVPIRRLGVRVSELSEMSGQSSITNYF